jgi:glutaredoxin
VFLHRLKARSSTLAAAAVVVCLGAAGACHRGGTKGAGPSASSSSEVATLPPLVLKDDTANVLLTWVDEHGDFHVVEHVADVPEAGRQAVRVVVADRSDGTGESIYVADLRAKGPDSAYPVKAMARAEWDELGASKRKARLEALAPRAAPPPESSAAPGSGAGGIADPTAHANVSAIVYGASWCNPCHQAQALLESLGVKVTKKDIEESDGAQREMQEKLRRIHRQGGSIPVIDVMGQIFVGYSEGALRAAVAKARSGTL